MVFRVEWFTKNVVIVTRVQIRDLSVIICIGPFSYLRSENENHLYNA